MNLFFAHPWVLLLLVVPIVLAWWECTREGHPIRMPFDYAAPRHHLWLSLLVTLANLLPVLLLAVAIVALAGPRRFAPPKTERVMTNIQFCLDLSGSMRMPMPPPPGYTSKPRIGTGRKRLGYGGDYCRLDGATDAINDFISLRKEDSYGLTVFGNEYLHWMPLTSDTNAIAMATPFIGRAENALPQWFGGTSIGKALMGCHDELVKRPAGDRMIVLVSDGQSADLGGGNDARIAADLAEAKIAVYLILIGGEAARPEMYTIANLTGGGVFAATDSAGLKTIFQRIDKMQKVKFRQSAPMAVDWYEPLAIAGLALAALQALALLGIRYTPW